MNGLHKEFQLLWLTASLLLPACLWAVFWLVGFSYYLQNNSNKANTHVLTLSKSIKGSILHFQGTAQYPVKFLQLAVGVLLYF